MWHRYAGNLVRSITMLTRRQRKIKPVIKPVIEPINEQPVIEPVIKHVIKANNTIVTNHSKLHQISFELSGCVFMVNNVAEEDELIGVRSCSEWASIVATASRAKTKIFFFFLSCSTHRRILVKVTRTLTVYWDWFSLCTTQWGPKGANITTNILRKGKEVWFYLAALPHFIGCTFIFE